MPWRHPNLRAQQVAPKGFPGEGARRRRDPGLPGPPPPPPPPRDLRSVPGAWRSRGSRASRGSPEWWPASSVESSHTEPGVDVWRSGLRLPPLLTMSPRAARSRTGLRSLLLSPPHPRPEECEDSWRGSARKTSGSLGSLIGEFLPRRFREFLSQLGAEWVEQPPPPSEALAGSPGGCATGLSCFQWGAPPPPFPRMMLTLVEFLAEPAVSVRGLLGQGTGLSSMLQGWGPWPLMPDVAYLSSRGRSLNFQNSLKKSSLDQIPTLGLLRRDQEATKVKKADRPHGLQAPKLKAELTHSSSEEGSGHHRRCSPFRVRFADETVWDTALRYWERSRARKQLGRGAPHSTEPQPVAGRADPAALGAGREAPARRGRKAAEPSKEAPDLAPPEDVRVAFEDEVEGPRSGRSVPKQVAPGRSHSMGPGHHGCPELAGRPWVLTGRICPPQNRAHSLPTRIRLPAWLAGAGGVQQGITGTRPATPSEAALERAFGSVGRWVESLPSGALDFQAKEEAAASSPFRWDNPSLPIPELEDYLFEDTSMNRSVPYIPRASTQRQQRDRKSFLGAHSILDPVGKPPCSWSQKLESFLPSLELHRFLNRGRPKGYQLLLPSVTRQQAQR
ncbi:uncharacterized protein C9orf50 homolog [Phyllostomus discolor]|uniref:Uncharacterized protein C9orf50 homolog n=1 Tax=Phyllostomus discolor TaxID=89673 RepID=A0A7E6D9R3_9CHIR|nr:uncharacterized protein C9orf50 homolog [Phyllostomus discolor]